MNISTSIHTLPQAEAREKYRTILAARPETPLNLTRKRVYHALSKGHKIIDIYTAIEQAGLNGLKEPRIAICRADAELCYFNAGRNYDPSTFRSTDNGGGWFSMENRSWKPRTKEPVILPPKTFPERIGGKLVTLKTTVPQVPQEHMPRGALHNYYVLWEVDKWTQEPPRDPFLLRRLSKNLFEILAEWDLSDLEWSIARGSI